MCTYSDQRVDDEDVDDEDDEAAITFLQLAHPVTTTGSPAAWNQAEH